MNAVTICRRRTLCLDLSFIVFTSLILKERIRQNNIYLRLLIAQTSGDVIQNYIGRCLVRILRNVLILYHSLYKVEEVKRSWRQ